MKTKINLTLSEKDRNVQAIGKN